MPRFGAQRIMLRHGSITGIRTVDILILVKFFFGRLGQIGLCPICEILLVGLVAFVHRMFDIL